MEEIKVLLPYFVKFKKNDTILSKNSSDNCVIRSLDQHQISIIIYNVSIFFANNSC